MSTSTLGQLGGAFKNIVKDVDQSIGKNLLSSNGKINDAYNGLFGVKGMYKSFRNRGEIGEDWVKKALKENYTMNNGKNINWTNVAGTAALGATAARVVSGGGLTKDANGNTNIVALPFI